MMRKGVVGPRRTARARLVLVIHGPNLNLLGKREPAVYGRTTLAAIDKQLAALASELGVTVETFQSNSEGKLVDRIQAARDSAAAIVINAGAYTHTSVAIRDALLVTELPVIEVHLSNIFRREDFRHHSYVSLAARAVICGLGKTGYRLALDALAELLGTTKEV